MDDTSLHDWEDTGLLEGIEREKEVCSYMFEEAYDYLSLNRNKLSSKVVDRFLPTTRMIFELKQQEYVNVDYSKLSNVISDVVVEQHPKEYLFQNDSIIFKSAKKYIKKYE